MTVADEDLAVDPQNVAQQVLFDNVDDDNDSGQRAQKQPPTPLSDKDSTTAEKKILQKDSQNLHLKMMTLMMKTTEIKLRLLLTLPQLARTLTAYYKM